MAKRIRKYRLKYMIFHDAFWVTYLYTVFFAMLQFSQASMKTLWDGLNITLAIFATVLYIVFTIYMIYMGNKYKSFKNVDDGKKGKGAHEDKKIPRKFSFIRM